MEKIIFTDHLAIMIGAGLPVGRALEALATQTKNKKFAGVIVSINDDIRQGRPLSDAFAKHPEIFSGLFVSMVKAGEASGNLDEALKVLAGQMKKDYDLRSKIKRAMIYPAIIIAVALGVGVLMMTLVAPKLVSISTFNEINFQPPFSTRVLINISDFLTQYWWLAFTILAAIFLSLGATLKTKAGNWLLLRTPVLGEIIKKINSARLARSLGSLIKSGVPITQSLRLTSETLTNSQFKKSLSDAARAVQEGQTLSQALKNYPRLYPAMVNQMVQVGEETGTLDEILIRLAEFYEEALADLAKNMISVIEPALMIIIGAAIGFFAISILQPIYSIALGI